MEGFTRLAESLVGSVDNETMPAGLAKKNLLFSREVGFLDLPRERMEPLCIRQGRQVSELGRAAYARFQKRAKPLFSQPATEL